MSKYNNRSDAQTEAVAKAATSFFKHVKAGIGAVKESSAKLIVFLVFTVACCLIFYLRNIILLAAIPEDTTFHILQILLPGSIIAPILLLAVFGSSEKGNNEFDEAFERIKFCNKAKEYPIFLRKEIDGKKEIYSFRSPGLTLGDWRSRQTDLEASLDCNIVKIEPDKNTKQIIRLHTVPTSQGISDDLTWSNDFVRENDFEIVAGKALLEEVIFNLDKYPHALIAGVTGSGKSVILRCMLWQCILKGAKIYMIDFKGGVEFAAFEDFGEVISDRKNALELLKELTKEMKLRLELYRETRVRNLTEYNQKHPGNQLCRIIFVCDEIAEMLDKTGLAKADAAIYYEIEKEMSSIARLARSPGINMLLATQRPDAKVLVGQIKNNLPIRISGRMTDPQASEMVLGNTKASDLGDTLGRFLYSVGSDTYEFQAYNFQDSSILRGNYQVGTMLIDNYGEHAETLDEDDLDQEEDPKEFNGGENDDFGLEEFLGFAKGEK